nr:MAG TPA: hypothetical protein [Crassvirales sp.]
MLVFIISFVFTVYNFKYILCIIINKNFLIKCFLVFFPIF